LYIITTFLTVLIQRVEEEDDVRGAEDEDEVLDQTELATDLFVGFDGLEPVFPFHKLPLLDRAKVVQLLCEYRAHTPEFVQKLRHMDQSCSRWDPVGSAGRGSRYFHASYWGLSNTRVYALTCPSKGVEEAFELLCEDPAALKALIQRLKSEKGGRDVASALKEVYTEWNEWVLKKQQPVAPKKLVVVLEPTKRSARLASFQEAHEDQRAKEAVFLERVKLLDEQKQHARVQAMAKAYEDRARSKKV